MPQNLIFPIRYGIPLSNENLKAVEVLSEGGLDQTQSIIENRPGCASKLTNFEVSLIGGYRRISGFAKYDPSPIGGASNTGPALGCAVFWPNTIIAARQNAADPTKYDLYRSGGGGWTRINPIASSGTCNTHSNTTVDNLSINTNLLCVGQPVSGTNIPLNTRIATIVNSSTITITNAATGTTTGGTISFAHPLNYTTGKVLQHCQYNWTGTNRIIFTDGVNYASKWDGTTFTILYKGPTNPAFCREFSGYLFLAGYTSNTGAVTISAPLDDTDYAPVDGAAEVVIGGIITGLRVWRSQLIIFCANEIHRIVGNSTDVTSSTPFTQFHITDKIGCPEGRTIAECNGDLLYLAPDGIRTISGTFNIGDTEIGSISRPIQSIVNKINTNTNATHAVVVSKKTQYRLFYPIPNAPSDTLCYGIIGGIRRYRDGHEGWEWGELQGINPSCCDSGYLQDGQEYVIHGGQDGYIYRQEIGNNFNGAAIPEVYTTVPLELGDYGLRKCVYRVTVYISLEGASPTLSLTMIYDYSKTGVIQPLPYIMSNIGGRAALYDTTPVYDGTDVYDTIGDPIYRQSVQGSGFVTQLQLNSAGGISDSYIVQGYYIEFYPAGRR
jgi:hypothetical protein